MARQIGGVFDVGDSDRRPTLRRLSRRAVLVAAFQAAATLVACTVPLPPSPVTPTSSLVEDQGSGSTPSQSARCARSLPTVVPPTAIPYPGYAQQEPETGLHVTSGALAVDLPSYRLLVSGLVNQPLSLILQP